MKIEIRGLEELVKKLGGISEGLKREMEEGMDEAIKYVRQEVPGYPPAIPNSRYVRTRVLGNSLTTEVRSLGSEVVGVLGTETIYGPYVIGEERQARVHRGRWYTLQAVLRSAKDGIIRIFEERVQRMLNG